MLEPHVKTNDKTKTMAYNVFFNFFKSINIAIISSAMRSASSAPGLNFTTCREIVTKFCSM